jgi:hypothetical protein
MGIILQPLTGNRYWKEVSFYRAYADLARDNLINGRNFEAVIVCCIGLDVLINTIVDRLLHGEHPGLSPEQKQILQELQRRSIMSGIILQKFQEGRVLHKRLLVAFHKLNSERNKVIHPIRKGKLKDDVITPHTVSTATADRFYRLFCHVMDLAGGRSPRSEERELNQYIASRRKMYRDHFPKRK